MSVNLSSMAARADAEATAIMSRHDTAMPLIAPRSGPSGVAMLDNGQRYPLDVGDHVIWNDGPGPALLVIAPMPTLPKVPAS